MKDGNNSDLSTGYGLRVASYQNADVVIVAFPLHKSSSLHRIRDKWHQELKAHCPNAPIILVGTNMDKRDHFNQTDCSLVVKNLITADEVVDYKNGLRVAKEIGAMKYLETSAQFKIGFEDLYNEICQLLIKRNAT
jgi:GTPase SAR1 family protein